MMSLFFAALCGLLGGLSWYEHIAGVNLGIDEFLFEGTWGQTASAAPMRLGVPASISFFVLGIALALAGFGTRSRKVASGLAVIPVAVASLSLVGYWYGASQLFGIGRYTGIAWQTAMLITALSLGTIITLREHGFMALLLRNDAGGIVARRFLIPIIAIPVLLGWLRNIGQSEGVFDHALGSALRTLAEIGLFTAFLWWTAISISEHAGRARKASDALSEIERRFSKFMECLPGLAWIKDVNGRYIYANDSAIKAFGVPRQKLYGLTDREFQPREIAEEFASNDRLALKENGGLQIIESLQHPDGEIHSSLVTKFPMPGGPDGVMLVGGIAIDISDRLSVEKELREAHRRKDEFLATLAHELRNPLAPIRYSVQLCRSNAPATDREWALDVVDRQVQQMARLLDDLLDVSRISYGKLTLRPEKVSLSEIIDRAIETSQPLRDTAEQKIEIELPGGPITLTGDPVRLEQVFANLLNNAAKYGGKGSQVWLKGSVTDSEAIISIRDDGAGIPPDRLSDIFEMFSQVKSAKNTTQGGLGIGLSLVRGLVELHGGRITAHSEGPGKGSEFVVHLPVELGQPAANAAPVSSPQPGGGEHRAMRLLVADDLPDSAESIAAFFRSQGHTVRAAYDGQEAVEVALEFQPDAVFLDVGMPKLDGHEVCRRIRSEPWGKEILIVAITGWGQQADRQLTTQAGFNHHLVKPVEVNELIALLNQFRKAG